MSSIRRKASSRENGAKSKGPVSAEGKAKSCMNNLRHGVLARDLLMKNENRQSLDAHMAAFIDRLRPADDMELELVHEIGAAAWRLHRARAAETRMLDNHVDKFLDAAPEDQKDIAGGVAGGFDLAMVSPSFLNLGRYMGRLRREFERAFNNLAKLRTDPAFQIPGDEDSPYEPTLENLDAPEPVDPAQENLPSPEPAPENEAQECNNEPTLETPNVSEPKTIDASPENQPKPEPAGRVITLQIINGTRENPIIIPKR